jgi:hypothetical protein
MNVGFYQNSARSAVLRGSAVKICASLFRVKDRENRKGAKNAKHAEISGFFGIFHFGLVNLEHACYNIIKTGAVTRLAPVCVQGCMLGFGLGTTGQSPGKAPPSTTTLYINIWYAREVKKH